MAWLSAIPGLIALVGAAIGIGGLMQRLKRVEQDVSELKDVHTEVAVIAERTKNTADTVKATDAKVDTVMEHLLSEARTFMGSQRQPQRRPVPGG